MPKEVKCLWCVGGNLDPSNHLNPHTEKIEDVDTKNWYKHNDKYESCKVEKYLCKRCNRWFYLMRSIASGEEWWGFYSEEKVCLWNAPARSIFCGVRQLEVNE